jgi:hypothetical protein
MFNAYICMFVDCEAIAARNRKNKKEIKENISHKSD